MLISSISNYLTNNAYNINLSMNKIYVNNYKSVNTITDTRISIVFEEFTLNINGQNFKICQMVDNEILFNGHIESMEYIYK